MKYKCSTCGRIIEHGYYLDGKIYGKECYKMALALKYAHLQEIKNDDYIRKCVAAIETFRNKIFKDKWNQDFQKSTLNQWDTCNKLTGKQIDVIIKKFEAIEYLEYRLTYLELLEDAEKIEATEKEIFNKISKEYLLKEFMYDERFLNILSNQYRNSKARGRKYFIVESKDVDEKESIIQILKEVDLKELQNDEYINIINTREV